MQQFSLIEKAAKKAAILHAGQTRRADGAPYITHPFLVAMMVARYTQDEATIAAALLHDTIEDTAYTVEEMETDFGKKVKDIVMGVTEPKVSGAVEQSWAERKAGYLKMLKQAGPESALVSAADKIQNLSSLIDDYAIQGPALLKKFHASMDQRLAFERSVLAIVKEKLESPIVSDLTAVIGKAEKIFLKK